MGLPWYHTGRDENKIATAGLTPVFDDKTTFFKEAKMVFVCRKIDHESLLEKGFVNKSLIDNNYKDRGFHEMYTGEILKVLVQKR